MTPTMIAGYLVLFTATAAGFVFAAMLVGKLLRPHKPTVAKLAPYECGEPAVGSSFVQFDLRFYVVALVFIIFEVEIAFFFPWAAVFGKLSRLRQPAALASEIVAAYRQLGVAEVPLTPGGHDPEAGGTCQLWAQQASGLALAAMIDLAVFFGMLLVGFAYAWQKRDLDWVRAISSPQ